MTSWSTGNVALLFALSTWCCSGQMAVADEQGSPHRAASENFVVHSSPLAADQRTPSAVNAIEVLRWCESTRQELGRVWCGKGGLAAWDPRCDVHLHASIDQYLKAVGPSGVQTAGSSWIRIEHQQVVARRIDLLITPGNALPALPHELTHVILADRFGSRQPPHWLDEGAAMLADTQQKQSLHARDCRQALQQGTCLPLTQLLHLEQFASADQMPAFYGQSASLLRFFCERGDLSRVTRFGIDAMNVGYERALKEHYGIEGVAALEQQWRSFAYGRDSASRSLQLMTVSFAP